MTYHIKYIINIGTNVLIPKYFPVIKVIKPNCDSDSKNTCLLGVLPYIPHT